MKRIGTLVTATLAVFALALSLGTKAAGQETPPDTIQVLNDYQGPKQSLNIYDPEGGIVLEGKGDDAVKYTGLIYVKVFPVSPRLIKKFGAGPFFEAETYPSGVIYNGNRAGTIGGQFPLGEYEVDFSMRDGDTMRICIKRGILLTANGGANVQAEMSGTAKTLVIGGDVSYQTLENAVGGMARQVAALQAEVDVLKGKAGAAPAK